MEAFTNDIVFSVSSITLHNGWKSPNTVHTGGKYNYFVSNRGVCSQRVRVSLSKTSDNVSRTIVPGCHNYIKVVIIKLSGALLSAVYMYVLIQINHDLCARAN